jgi:hypothetical protein
MKLTKHPSHILSDDLHFPKVNSCFQPVIL